MEEDGSLTLSNITPGDKIDFTIDIQNNSTVIVKYRAFITVEGTAADKELLKALEICVDEQDYNGDFGLDWTFAAPDDVMDSIEVSVKLPESANNDYRNKTIKLVIAVEALQGNAETPADETPEYVGTAAELKTLIEDALKNPVADEVTKIQLASDMDIASTWETMKLGGYNGVNSIEIDGNGKTIRNLNAPLISGAFAGGGVITFKDITIENANISMSNSTASNDGIGALIAYTDSSGGVVIDNCKLIDSNITNTSGYAGGFVGYASSKVTVKDCEISNSNVTGGNSSGLVAGMFAAPDSTITNCTITGGSVTSTKDGSWRVGEFVGTTNYSGVVFTNVRATNVTLTQTKGTDNTTQASGSNNSSNKNSAVTTFVGRTCNIAIQVNGKTYTTAE